MSAIKTHYIGPLVPESRSQRRVFQESLMNAKANEEILTKFFSDMNPTKHEVPPLLTTNPTNVFVGHTPSKVVNRTRSKVQCLIENHLEKRKEKRQYFHRNCVPVEREEIRRVILRNTDEQEIREEIVANETRENEPVDDIIDSPKSSDKSVPSVEATTVQPVATQQAHDDIRELEKLIEESHQLLKAEGIVETKSIFPPKLLGSDREILEELEKDLEQIMYGHNIDTGGIPDSALEQLENEPGELIKG